MPPSSQASSELSTASLMVVRRAFEGLSKPSRCRFLTKNSETEISRCLAAIDWAVARGAGPRRVAGRGPGDAAGSATAFSSGGRRVLGATAGGSANSSIWGRPTGRPDGPLSRVLALLAVFALLFEAFVVIFFPTALPARDDFPKWTSLFRKTTQSSIPHEGDRRGPEPQGGAPVRLVDSPWGRSRRRAFRPAGYNAT